MRGPVRSALNGNARAGVRRSSARNGDPRGVPCPAVSASTVRVSVTVAWFFTVPRFQVTAF